MFSPGLLQHCSIQLVIDFLTLPLWWWCVGLGTGQSWDLGTKLKYPMCVAGTGFPYQMQWAWNQTLKWTNNTKWSFLFLVFHISTVVNKTSLLFSASFVTSQGWTILTLKYFFEGHIITFQSEVKSLKPGQQFGKVRVHVSPTYLSVWCP